MIHLTLVYPKGENRDIADGMDQDQIAQNVQPDLRFISSASSIVVYVYDIFSQLQLLYFCSPKGDKVYAVDNGRVNDNISLDIVSVKIGFFFSN